MPKLVVRRPRILVPFFLMEWKLSLAIFIAKDWSEVLLYLNTASRQTTFKTLKIVRRGSRGVVSWTCDPVLALGHRFDSNSCCSFCCNTLEQGINCTLPSLLRRNLQQEVLYLCTHYTAHTKIPSHSLKKSRSLWSARMNDNAQTHERMKLNKTYKNVLPW